MSSERRWFDAASVEVLTASGAAFVVVTGDLGQEACDGLVAIVDELPDGGTRRVVVDYREALDNELQPVPGIVAA